MTELRKLAAELGYWPATTNPEDIDRHRRLNAALDKAPTMEQISRKWDHRRVAAERAADEAAKREALADLYEGEHP